MAANVVRRVNVSGKYVSRKINKIRWRPEKNAKLGIPADSFVCGSYDDENNQVSLWRIPEDIEDFTEAALVTTAPHPDGDVTAIKFITGERFLASSSGGNASLFEITTDEYPSIIKIFTWEKLHYLNRLKINDRKSCTALDALDEDVLTVGNDGKLNVLSVRDTEAKSIRVIEADSSPICSVCFLKHNEGLTGGMRGQMKVWDLRTDCKEPSNTMYLNKLDLHIGPRGYPETHMPSPTCLMVHPTQPHILMNGGEDGSITVWDLRDSSVPICVLESHGKAVKEARFHPEYPDHMFSCSRDGQLWQWNNCYPPISNPYETSLLPRDQCTWMALGTSKHRPYVTSLMSQLRMSINTLDIAGNTLVCGTDSEAIYVCRDIHVKSFRM